MSADEDNDVAAYLRELEASTARRADSSGSEASLSSAKPKASRFSRKSKEPVVSPDLIRTPTAKIPAKPAAGVQPSENVTTALQKFLKLDQKYSKKQPEVEEEDSSSSLSSSRSASLVLPKPPTEAKRRSSLKSTSAPAPAPPPEPPKNEKRVKFEENDSSQSSPSPTQPEPVPVRRFSLSMEEIHSIEELETSESERSHRHQQPLVEVTKKEPSEPPVIVGKRRENLVPVGGHVRGLVVDLPSPEVERQPTVPIVESSRKEVQPIIVERVTKILMETSTQTTGNFDDRRTIDVTSVTPTSFRPSSLDVRKYIDPTFVNAIAEEDPAETLVKHLMDMHVGLIASNIRRQRSLYQSTVDCLRPDHRYVTSKSSKS